MRSLKEDFLNVPLYLVDRVWLRRIVGVMAAMVFTPLSIIIGIVISIPTSIKDSATSFRRIWTGKL